MTVKAICEMATNALVVLADMMNEKAKKILSEDEKTARELIITASELKHMAHEIGTIGGERK